MRFPQFQQFSCSYYGRCQPNGKEMQFTRHRKLHFKNHIFFYRENKPNNPNKALCNTEHCVKISGVKSLTTQSKPENNFSRRSEILPNLISLLEIAGNMSVRDTSIFGCESSPISRNVRQLVSQSVSLLVRQMQSKAK